MPGRGALPRAEGEEGAPAKRPYTPRAANAGSSFARKPYTPRDNAAGGSFRLDAEEIAAIDRAFPGRRRRGGLPTL